jgi:hypothetical protein
MNIKANEVYRIAKYVDSIGAHFSVDVEQRFESVTFTRGRL